VSRYLLDTNVVSETRRKRQDNRVASFFATVQPSELYISVLTFGELRKGAALKERSDAAIASIYTQWIDGLEAAYDTHILGVDARIAKLWGRLSADRSRPMIDTLLAATAIIHDLTLVTRNTADMSGLPVSLLNPWLF
jgi:predicted nucleic acid-binding protein